MQPKSAAWNDRPLPARFSVRRAGFLYKKALLTNNKTLSENVGKN